MWRDGGELRVGTAELIDAWRTLPDAYLWVDLEHDASDATKVLTEFGADDTVIEQTLAVRYPPKLETVIGDAVFMLLRGTLTNDETGATYTVNSSGVAVQTLRPDGSLQTYETRGPVGLGFHATDVGLPRGYYIFRGHHVVDSAPDGTRTLTLDQGSEDNVCAHLD